MPPPMRQLFANVGALLVAGVSFPLTIGFVLGLQQLVGLNLFSLMWWFVIPLGAFVTGLLAASGYYVGAVKLNVKPTRIVAIGTLVIAALVQGVLYFSQYAMAKTEDGQPISNFVDFPRFIGWMRSMASSCTGIGQGVLTVGWRLVFSATSSLFFNSLHW